MTKLAAGDPVVSIFRARRNVVSVNWKTEPVSACKHGMPIHTVACVIVNPFLRKKLYDSEGRTFESFRARRGLPCRLAGCFGFGAVPSPLGSRERRACNAHALQLVDCLGPVAVHQVIMISVPVFWVKNPLLSRDSRASLSRAGL